MTDIDQQIKDQARNAAAEVLSDIAAPVNAINDEAQRVLDKAKQTAEELSWQEQINQKVASLETENQSIKERLAGFNPGPAMADIETKIDQKVTDGVSKIEALLQARLPAGSIPQQSQAQSSAGAGAPPEAVATPAPEAEQDRRKGRSWL